jgi:outer membrane receptor protein involved in Fe transport
VDLSWLGRERDYREPAAAFGPVHDTHESRRAEAVAGLDRVADHSVVRLAAGASVDRLESTTDGSRERRAGHARARVSLDGQLGPGEWRLTGAARVDGIEGFEPFLSPRLAADLALGPHVALRGSAGLSYRTPSFDELFWPPRATAAGNPDLRAETGADADLGITLGGLPLRGRVSLDGFVRRVDDLIQWTPGAGGIWRPHNIGQAALAGLEAELDGRIPLPAGLGLDVVASGTFLRSEDRTGEPNVDGQDLPYRPRFAGALSAILPALGGEFETVWRAVADAYVTRANTKTLPGHIRGDLLWRRPFPGGLRLDAGVTNLTDARARDFRDYPLPGRAIVAGITWERTLR